MCSSHGSTKNTLQGHQRLGSHLIWCLAIKWDYTTHNVNLFIPRYIKCALLHFSHPHVTHSKHSLHTWQKPNLPSTAPCLDATDTKCIQEVIGVLLYYVQAVNNTLLTALGAIATQQAKGTQDTIEAITQLLNYCATHPDATMQYHASDRFSGSIAVPPTSLPPKTIHMQQDTLL